ncbi:hypothetical protein LXL04_022890 [Taraxacum kok-saghyz]
MRSPVNNIHSVSLHAPQILLFSRGIMVIINVNSSKSAGLFGTRFRPVYPTSEGRINISRNYKVLYEHSNLFQLKSSFLRFTMIFTVMLRVSVKTGTTGTYDSRKSAYELRDYRLLRNHTEMAVISKPVLQTINPSRRFCSSPPPPATMVTVAGGGGFLTGKLAGIATATMAPVAVAVAGSAKRNRAIPTTH